MRRAAPHPASPRSAAARSRVEAQRQRGLPPGHAFAPLPPSPRLRRTDRKRGDTSRSNIRPARPRRGFTLLEILLALTLVGLLLVAMNTFIYSMGELWGQRTDVRLFEQHVRAVTRFLENELRASALPPAARAGSTPIGLQEVKPQSGLMEKMLTFELPAGSRLFSWPERPLPEVICSFQVRPNEGLVLLWHSRLEKNFETDPPRETVVTPLATALAYDYYDPDSRRWTTETQVKLDPQGQPLTPQRLRLKFSYQKLTRESVITLPVPGPALPVF